ncbi:MAG: flagellar motor protein MotA [Alphaproteobacteria bacterium]|nr:flagellar motor protein MotA [Alphaproteobacteria bacterium]
MSRPQTFIFRMALFLVLVGIVVVLLYPVVSTAFLANPWLNGLIISVFLFGIVHSFRQLLRIEPEVRWIESFRRAQPGLSVAEPPTLLAPMATMLGERRGRVTLSATAMRSLLDGIGSRLDESRETSRYMIGLLIFLGLLGTFWGLILTMRSIEDVIQGLEVTGSDFGAMFANLKVGLGAPLEGMGTAFSTSLFGLAGSLVLGFLDLQSGQALNRFYNELEEWLSSLTRLPSGAGLADSDQSVPAYVSALLEQTAESLESLQRILVRGEESRRAADTSLTQLAERLATLTDQMRTEQAVLLKLAEGQVDIKPILVRLTEVAAMSAGGMDEGSRTHIRNIDVAMNRLLEETIKSRSQLVEELRGEIKLLARTVAAAVETRRPS